MDSSIKVLIVNNGSTRSGINNEKLSDNEIIISLLSDQGDVLLYIEM